MGKSVHTGHRSRMKEEFLARGVEGWPDHRVLEFALFFAIPQGDVNDLAHELIDHFGSLSGVLDASFDDLRKVKGVGALTAVFLRMLPTVAQRYQSSRSRKDTIVSCQEDAIELLEPYFFGARNELVYILCLDGKDQILAIRRVAEGSIQAADVNLRRIAEEAFALRASKVYLAHNHVNCLAIPSQNDWMTTDVVRGALAPFGIELVDHFVFENGEVVSLADSEAHRGLEFLLVSGKNRHRR